MGDVIGGLCGSIWLVVLLLLGNGNTWCGGPPKWSSFDEVAEEGMKDEGWGRDER